MKQNLLYIGLSSTDRKPIHLAPLLSIISVIKGILSIFQITEFKNSVNQQNPNLWYFYLPVHDPDKQVKG